MFIIKWFCLVLLVTIYMTVQAEIITDGTLGNAIQLEGPDFLIGADLGQQRGTNLFHSFSTFNINKAETATFLGSENITNIIGRITGGNQSIIDGTLSATMSDVNLYLINPNGFVFGPHIKLNLGGSLYLATANRLYLGDNGIFDVSQPSNSILTSADPSAFGFLDTTAATIRLSESELAIPEGKTLSIAAEEIRLENSSHLVANSGRIHLTAVTQADYLPIEPKTALENIKQQGGKIVLDNSSIDVGKQGGGDIFIRAGQFEFKNKGDIVANTFGKNDGGIIVIEANQLSFENGARIDSRTFGAGEGGHVVITVLDQATISDSDIITTSRGSSADTAIEGNAGTIELTAHTLTLSNSNISTTTFGNGDGGNINIRVESEINLINASTIQASTESGKTQAGNAGPIFIQAHNLRLIGENSKIDNSTLSSGQGGSITLKINNQLYLADGAVISADSKGSGGAGTITLNADRLEMQQGVISTMANNADGGNIIINAHSLLQMIESRITSTVTSGQGDGGNVAIGNPQNLCLQSSEIVANSTAGNGGLIIVVTEKPLLKENSVITASSETGLDGAVKIDIPNVDITSLPIAFFDASSLIKERCESRLDGQFNSFVVVGRSGLPNAPDDLQPYTPLSN